MDHSDIYSGAGAIREPRYVQVYKAILAAIDSAEYRVGDLLPAEAVLCERYAVSRTTIREALRRLSEAGVVEKIHGVGTTVKNTGPRSNYVVAVRVTDLMHYDEKTTLTMIDRRPIVTGPVEAKLLGCQIDESWMYLRGLRTAAGQIGLPMSLLEIYIPARYRDIAQQDMIGDHPYYQRIAERYATATLSIEQEIRAMSISDEAANHLRVKPGSAGLLITRRFLGPNDKLMQVSINTHPSERFSYKILLSQVPVSMLSEAR